MSVTSEKRQDDAPETTDKNGAVRTDGAVYFHALAERWEQETGHLSSVAQMAKHPAYAEIVALGEAAVPWILRRLQIHPSFRWFFALNTLSPSPPVIPDASRGKLQEVTALWLQWGRAKGIVT